MPEPSFLSASYFKNNINEKDTDTIIAFSFRLDVRTGNRLK